VRSVFASNRHFIRQETRTGEQPNVATLDPQQAGCLGSAKPFCLPAGRYVASVGPPILQNFDHVGSHGGPEREPQQSLEALAKRRHDLITMLTKVPVGAMEIEEELASRRDIADFQIYTSTYVGIPHHPKRARDGEDQVVNVCWAASGVDWRQGHHRPFLRGFVAE
jgi:hypothetical protein